MSEPVLEHLRSVQLEPAAVFLQFSTMVVHYIKIHLTNCILQYYEVPVQPAINQM